MLTATFIHAQGVGFSTERALWQKGVRSWDLYREQASSLGLSRRTRDSLSATVDASVAALEAHDAKYFARELPSGEHWRAARTFTHLGFLDIETDGGMGPGSTTVIGLSDGLDCRIYVRGRDLDEFVADCQRFDGFVTFFGAGFDLPMLRREYPVLERIFRERLHIDLCPALRKLGYRGGLKSIEQQLDIHRVPEAEGLDGLDAVRLWKAYRRGGRGSEEALDQLLAYNREDVVNMVSLLEFSLPRLRTACGFEDILAGSAPVLDEAVATA
ncbi:MAG: ribonuclease H-like domain-containing protein [Capsulimonadaceae bacterium]|nr:ribonuclease H-like domain-containing protein [Capsulimonadaceae bacterium]